MSNCFVKSCNEKADIYCDCSDQLTYACSGHIQIHMATKGSHRQNQIIEETPRDLVYIKCQGIQCSGLAKVFCNCNNRNLCLSCLENHLVDSSNTIHTIEVKYPKSANYQDCIHPLEVFLRRAQCDPGIIDRVKARKVTIRQMLNWDLKTLNSYSEVLGLTSTLKYLLWEEINYIKIVTEKYILKDEYMARLIFGLEDDTNSK
jgi:hypothetical protein